MKTNRPAEDDQARADKIFGEESALDVVLESIKNDPRFVLFPGQPDTLAPCHDHGCVERCKILIAPVQPVWDHAGLNLLLKGLVPATLNPRITRVRNLRHDLWFGQATIVDEIAIETIERRVTSNDWRLLSDLQKLPEYDLEAGGIVVRTETVLHREIRIILYPTREIAEEVALDTSEQYLAAMPKRELNRRRKDWRGLVKRLIYSGMYLLLGDDEEK